MPRQFAQFRHRRQIALPQAGDGKKNQRHAMGMRWECGLFSRGLHGCGFMLHVEYTQRPNTTAGTSNNKIPQRGRRPVHGAHHHRIEHDDAAEYHSSPPPALAAAPARQSQSQIASRSSPSPHSTTASSRGTTEPAGQRLLRQFPRKRKRQPDSRQHDHQRAHQMHRVGSTRLARGKPGHARRYTIQCRRQSSDSPSTAAACDTLIPNSTLSIRQTPIANGPPAVCLKCAS